MSEYASNEASIFRCANCKKLFDTSMYLSWPWWYGAKICCSYKCMRQMRSDDPQTDVYAKPKKKRPSTGGGWNKKLSESEISQAIHLLSKGISIPATAKLMGRSRYAIQKIYDRMNA